MKLLFPRIPCVLAVGLGAAVVSTAVASGLGLAAATQVSLDSHYDFMNHWLYTHVGDDRGLDGPEHDPARDNLVFLLESYGLDVVLEPFDWFGSTCHNVVATQFGRIYPDQEYIIGAHFDSVGNPGADDNGSGVALLLEAARILSQYESDYTIRYIAFDREEQGLVGSFAYVEDHWADDVRGMISADMVAYDPDTEHCKIFGNIASDPIISALAAAIAEYGDGLTYTFGGDLPFSDHAPFEADGLQACRLDEGSDNPFYHTQEDAFETSGNLNFPYAVKMTRSVVGWLADAAGVIVASDYLAFSYPAGLPEFSSPAGGTRVRVEVTGVGAAIPLPGSGLLHYNIGLGWNVVPMEEVADNVYDAYLPARPCGAEVRYYFSAAATDGSVFTHPARAPDHALATIAAYGRVAVFEDYFDVDPGWDAAGLWAFGQPTGGGGMFGAPDPTSGYTGSQVYGYNLDGDYESLLPERHLTSFAIDCTDARAVRLSFWRWLGVEQVVHDHAFVHVSYDGVNWELIWENIAEFTDDSWVPQEFDISAVADDQPTVYLRWTMGPTDESASYCGWNIDDVVLTALLCEPPAAIGDLNCDGAVNFFDIDAFVLAITDLAGYEVAYPDCDIMLADCNGDGDVDFFDIDAFVMLITGG